MYSYKDYTYITIPCNGKKLIKALYRSAYVKFGVVKLQLQQHPSLLHHILQYKVTRFNLCPGTFLLSK